MSAAIPDHLVVAAETLEQGCDHVEAALGVRPQPGGRHVAMGTHNALLSIGARFYLEVIAIDPDGAAPSRPRWFDLDEPRMRAAVRESPKLIHFVARTDDLAQALRRSTLPLGEIHAMARGDYRWKMTIPDDGHLPGNGLVPTLIQWTGAHPADRMPESGIRLVALAGEHPEPASIRKAIAALELSDTLKVSYGRSPRLAAMLRTPRGVVTL